MLVSIVSLIISVFFAVYFYLKGKKIKKPLFSSRSTRLIGKEVNSIDGLTVYYDHKQLSALTITKLAFWNAGRDTISNSDLSGIDKLRIECEEDVEILSCDVLTQSKDAFAFSTQIEEDGKSITLSFDYIDYKGGAVLRIRHTGESSHNLYLKGSIKTVDSIEKKTVYSPPFELVSFRKPWLNILWSCFLILMGVFLLFCGVAVVYSPEVVHRFSLIDFSNSDVYRYIGTILFPVLIAAGILYIILFFKKVRPSLPTKLNAVYWNEDF